MTSVPARKNPNTKNRQNTKNGCSSKADLCKFDRVMPHTACYQIRRSMSTRRGARVDYRRLAGDADSSPVDAPAVVAAPAAAPRPAKAAKPAKRPTKAPKKSKKRRKETYSRFLYAVLKQIHPDKGISSRAMAVLNDMILHLFGEVAGAAKTLMDSTGTKTVKSRDIEHTVLLVCGRGPLGSHAVKEGQKALVKFKST